MKHLKKYNGFEVINENITRHDFGVYTDREEIDSFSKTIDYTNNLNSDEIYKIRVILGGRFSFYELRGRWTINSGEDSKKSLFLYSLGDFCYAVVVMSIRGVISEFEKLYIIDEFDNLLETIKNELSL